VKFDPAVYELRAADGEAVYVGASGQVCNRLRWHAQQQPWWGDVASIHLHRPTADEPLAALERRLIKELKPHHCRDTDSVLPPRGGRRGGVHVSEEAYMKYINTSRHAVAKLSLVVDLHPDTIRGLKYGRNVSVKNARKIAAAVGVPDLFDEQIAELEQAAA
jgi:hypothetical protein